MNPSREDYERVKQMLRVLERARPPTFRVGARCSKTGEAVEHRTPLDEAMANEERAEAEAAVESMDAAQMVLGLEGQFPEALAMLIRGYASEAFHHASDQWLDWLFEDGPNPLIVMKRLFALVKVKRPKLMWQMSFRDLGALFAETHAAMAMRCKVLFGEMPAEWKKPRGAREKMRLSAKNNNNRRGGKRAARSDGEGQMADGKS